MAGCLLAGLAAPWLLTGLASNGSAVLWMSLTSQVLLLATVATSWNVVAGYLGRIDLGHVTYFGAGAYGTGLALTALGWGLPGALLAGAAAAGLLAALLGTAVLRLSGAVFAVASLGLLVGVREVARIMAPLTGGGRGLTLPLFQPIDHFVAAVVLLLIALAVSWTLRRTALWPILYAVRDDEYATQARGVPTLAWKVATYGIAAAVTGAAGGLWAYSSTFIDPDLAFADTQNLQMVAAVVVGGMGTITGPLVGSAVLSIGRAVAWLPSDPYQVVLQGLALIAVVRFVPGGIVGAIARRRSLSGDRGNSRPPTSWRSPLVRSDVQSATGARSEVADQSRTTHNSTDRSQAVLHADRLEAWSGGRMLLHAVTLQVGPGEIVGVIGPNGSGKSALADCLTGLQQIAAGTVTVTGVDVTQHSPRRITRLGVARTFQDARVYGSLTLVENLQLCAAHAHRSGTRRRTSSAHEILDELGLQDSAGARARELSVEEQRLLEVGMALVAHPRVLVLDEAMASMAPDMVEVIKAAIRSRARSGTGAIVMEHDVGTVVDLARRVAVLHRGNIVAEGTPASVIVAEATEAAYFGGDVQQR